MFDRAFMRSIVFGDVQVVFVAIDDERDFRNVPLVYSKAGDFPTCRPASQMAGSIRESLGKQERLVLILLGIGCTEELRGDGRSGHVAHRRLQKKELANS